MAFLDWIRNRNQQQPVANKPQEQTPETAKQMYTREAAQDEAKRRSLTELPLAVQSRLDGIRETLQRATQYHDPNGGAAAPVGGMANREALRQNMMGQDRSTPALSPTGMHAGTPDSERISPLITPRVERPKTLPRTPPSWER
jgi:hypothetical protein